MQLTRIRMVIGTIRTIGMIGPPSQPYPVADHDSEQLEHPLADTLDVRIGHFQDD
jgi:hypothetical protein